MSAWEDIIDQLLTWGEPVLTFIENYWYYILALPVLYMIAKFVNII